MSRATKKLPGFLAVVLLGCAVFLPASGAWAQKAAKDAGAGAGESSATLPKGAEMHIAQMVVGDPYQRFYPGALNSLLEEANEKTALNFDPHPVVVGSFADEALTRTPFVYANFGDRESWDLPEEEVQGLREYLERGGFLYIDAGISADFLRGDAMASQRHSFAAWEVHPDLEALFQRIFADKVFQSLPRTHPIFRIYQSGLPDPEILPEGIRDFIVNEKWPQGSYSYMGLELNGRLAVVVSPIVAMGWPKDDFGHWQNPIAFRVRESAEGLSDMLKEAAYSGERFEVTREDGRKDIIYCQPATTPAWVQEPDGRWRVFRYYNSREISDYAHRFYTQLGLNLLVYAATQ